MLIFFISWVLYFYCIYLGLAYMVYQLRVITTVPYHMAVSRVVFLLLFVLCSLGSEGVTIDVHTAKDLIQIGYNYLDVRTVEEFQKGHVDAPKIVNIPYMFNTSDAGKNPQFLKEVSSNFNKEDRIIVGCKSRVRSRCATCDLGADGFKNVKNMGGGYLEWVKNKYPVKAPSVAKEEF